MEENNDFEKVTSEDYTKLRETFQGILIKLYDGIEDNPILLEKLQGFVVEVGVASHNILQRYGEADYYKELKINELEEQLETQRHKIAKMNIMASKLVTAAREFTTVSKRG